MTPRAIRLVFALGALAGLLSCNVSNTSKPDTLTFRLPDSLTAVAGKYDSVRLDLYAISGSDTVFVQTLFSDPYENPGQLANLPLPEGLNGDFLIRVSGFADDRKALDVGVAFTDGKAAKQPITYPIPEAPVNRAPAFTGGLEPRSLREGDILAITIKARDEDGDAVTITLQNLDSLRSLFPDRPEAISITPNADSLVLRFDPGAAPGNYRFRLAVRDAVGAVDIQVLVLTVGKVNRPPTLSFAAPNPGPAFRVFEGQTLSLRVEAADPDTGDRVRLLSLEQTPWPACGTGSYDTTTGMFSFTPGFHCVADGESSLPRLVFRSSDDGTPIETGEIASTLTVVDVNTAPRWADGPVSLTGKEGIAMSLDLGERYLGDAEQDSVTFSATCGAIARQPLRWTFTPGFRDSGQMVCTLTATDSHNPPANSQLDLQLTIADSARALEVDILSPERGAYYRDSIIRVSWQIEGILQTRDTSEKLLKEGANLVRRAFQDSLGNEGFDTVTVFLDTQAPEKASVRNLGWTNQARPRWTWKSGGGGTGQYRVRLDTLNLAQGGVNMQDTAYTAPWNLAEGRHVLYVQERDEAGNWSAVDSGTARVDLTAPAVAITGPADGHVTNQGSVTVGWSVDGNPQPPFTQTLTEGSNTVSRSVTDSAGNTGSASITVTQRSQVVFVNAAAAEGGDGNSWATALKSLQAGLAKADSGWEIWVANGTYFPGAGLSTETDTSFVMKVRTSLLGGFSGTEATNNTRDWTTNLTVIKGSSPAPGQELWPIKPLVLGSEGGRLDGFVLENGRSFYGSALYVGKNNMTVTNCTFRNNAGTAEEGGGAVQVHGNNFMISKSDFHANSNTSYAGAISIITGNTTIENCNFTGNRASSSGGAIVVERDASALINNSIFKGNISTIAGGAISHRGSVKINRSFFLENSSEQAGGAVYSQTGYIDLFNCVFAKNTVGGTGGALHIFLANMLGINLTLFQNHSQDKGGGLYLEGSEFSSSNSIFRNSIFWSNTAKSSGPQIAFGSTYLNGSTFDLQYSDLEGGVGAIDVPAGSNWIAGPGNISANPAFRAPDNLAGPDGFLMTSDDGLSPNGGPAINSGTLTDAPTTDIIGSSRPKGGFVDMGAYEP